MKDKNSTVEKGKTPGKGIGDADPEKAEGGHREPAAQRAACQLAHTA